jgi:hypothetical protein
MRPLPRAAVLAALLATATCASTAHAQSIWLDRTHAKTLHLELAKPQLDFVDDGFFTFAGFLSARLPLGQGIAFVGELPMATMSVDEGLLFGEEASTMVGNPYLGVETREVGSGGWFEFGLRPPLASEDEFALFAGLTADVDRWEAFIPNAFFVRAAAHWRDDPRDDGIGADLRVAPSVWIPEEDADTELFATYGAQVLLHSPQARGGAGLSGRWLVTEDDGDFGERSTHQLDIAADFLRGSVRPGLIVRIPLDDDGVFFGTAESVIGVTVNFVLD